MKNINLDNVENYKPSIDVSENVLFLKYVGLIHELIECCSESLIIKNKNYLKYIMIKGIQNTLYIYTFLMLYTNNVDLSIYHTQKSILYYIEFVGQIGEDSQNLLKLNTQDATLFIYKKTIFDVNSEYRKNFIESEDTNTKLILLERYTDIYNKLVIHMIDTHEFTNDNMGEVQKILFTKIYKVVETLIQIPLVCSHCNIDIKTKLDSIKELVFMLMSFNKSDFIRKNVWYLIESVVKLGVRKNINIDGMRQKIMGEDIERKLKHMSISKIVNYLCLPD